MVNDKTMTVQEAGSIGGRKTKERHGHDFYVAIGQLGGQVVKVDRERLAIYDKFFINHPEINQLLETEIIQGKYVELADQYI